MSVTPIAVLVWTCVAFFVSSAVVTLLALVGVLQLGGAGVANHNYYLKRLFGALAIEIIAVAVAVFYQQTRTPQLSELPDQFVRLQKRVEQLEARPGETGRPSSGPQWQLSRVGGDCPGKDIAETSGAEPDKANCTGGNVTAVCWDGTLFRNGTRGAWCTYKAIEPQQCVGGGAPGRLFRCSPTGT
jgi:hypothetical protein